MKKSPHILVVDDDRDIRTLVAKALEREEFRVSLAANGAEMRKALEGGAIDLVVLDIMMPGPDGLSICRDLRADQNPVPIILLTARGEDIDRIIGLEMGADDYLGKPFHCRELVARIRAVLRRTAALPPPDARPSRYIAFEGWRLDTAARELVAEDGSIISLSSGEYDLLYVFATHAQTVLSRDQLLDFAKGRSAALFDRSIDIQVSRLRRKLRDDARDPKLIRTVRGDGYIFTPDILS
jgi:two-component system OmpR family response regulator